jgi:hypothetical protein
MCRALFNVAATLFIKYHHGLGQRTVFKEAMVLISAVNPALTRKIQQMGMKTLSTM